MDGFAQAIAEHMKVVGSDGQHVGTVDRVEGERIKLTRSDSPGGDGHQHHFLPLSSVQTVEDDTVKLSISSERAKLMAKADGEVGPLVTPGKTGETPPA